MTTSGFLSLPLRGARRALGPLAWVLRAWSLSCQRRRLAELPPEVLQDIGVTPDQARAEAARSFWDVPSHWRR